MRNYPCNSPHAAGRIVALALLADGHLSGTELAVLERHRASERLGLTAGEMQDLVRHLAEDLVACGLPYWGGAHHLDEAVVAGILAEVDEPKLRETVLGLALAITQADDHFSHGELAVLGSAIRQWRGVHA